MMRNRVIAGTLHLLGSVEKNLKKNCKAGQLLADYRTVADDLRCTT